MRGKTCSKKQPKSVQPKQHSCMKCKKQFNCIPETEIKAKYWHPQHITKIGECPCSHVSAIKGPRSYYCSTCANEFLDF